MPQIKVLVSTVDVENPHCSICVFIPEIKQYELAQKITPPIHNLSFEARLLKKFGLEQVTADPISDPITPLLKHYLMPTRNLKCHSTV